MSKEILNIAQISHGLKTKKFSAVEVLNGFWKTIIENEPKVAAFLTLTHDQALVQAKEIDKKLARNQTVGRLAGVPIAIKDILTTRGIRTTAASRILENFEPLYNATCVDKIIDADAVIIGKTNCDEFAMGGSTENSAYTITKNPWDISRVPGGSSGGSAVAVAAGECVVALGTDTGGSIRQPASFCGVTGLKPTYGRVSRYGLMAMASSFDTAGPIGRSVADIAEVLNCIAGHDNKDATSSTHEVPDYVLELQKSVKHLRIGVPKEFFGEGLDPAVARTVRLAIDELTRLGAYVTEVSLPSMPYALAVYYVITPAEVSANLSRYDGIRFGKRLSADTLYETYARTRGHLLGAEVKRRIILGTYVLSGGYYEAYYKKAQAVRQNIKADFTRVFKDVDVLVTPTTPTVAFPIGSKSNDPLTMYMADIYTVPVNIAGLPGLSIPGGLVDGMPVGLQLIGRPWEESTVMTLGHAYQQVTSWHKQQPIL